MADFGFVALNMAMLLSGYVFIASLLGSWLNITELIRSARYAAFLVPLMLAFATGSLISSFVSGDFEVKYVAEHSNLAMEPWLTWVAFYAGNEGSLLFIAMVFSVLSAIAIIRTPAESRESLPYTAAVLMFVILFFTAVMSFLANPFEKLPVPPLDGRGINPLLTHPGMLIHPPMLMTGLIGVAIPFAFAIGHLLSGNTGDEWVESARLWALIVWGILTTGLLLGAWWAYTILGWGGYWAWDPVENAGLLPWLPLTAFVHSIMVQRRRRMFRMWNIVLVILAWTGAMYGMFMNRGGPVPSVHSFGQSTLGWVFLIFLAANLILAFGVFFWRYSQLRSTNSVESILSRESALLLNNVVFLLVALVVLWGMIYPLISQLYSGVMVTVGRPFYDVIAGPLFLMLVCLMAVGPLLPWRRTSGGWVRRVLLMPILIGIIVGLMGYFVGVKMLIPLLAFSICATVASTIIREWARGTQNWHRKGENYLRAFIHLIGSNRPRYGGYIAHLGVVILAFSVTGSSFYSIQQDVVLSPGDRTEIGRYVVEYISSESEMKQDRVERTALLHVHSGGRLTSELIAGYTFYPSFSMAATRAGIRSTFKEDLYVIANEFSEDGSAVFRIYVNPLVIWMWISGVFFVIGTMVALWPSGRAKPPVDGSGGDVTTRLSFLGESIAKVVNDSLIERKGGIVPDK